MNIQDIVLKLRNASDAYYNSGKQLMPDNEFDALVDQLRRLDPNHPFLKEVGAPPVKISVWPKIKHKFLMGSQAKVKTKEEFMEWAKENGPLIISDKMDGSTIVLTYEDDKLISAASRGDGLIGEDILPNVLKMQNVKEILPKFSGVLRGEAIIHLSDFNKHIKPLGYKNSRNSVNGLSRDTNNSELIKYIKIVYFDVISDGLKTETDKRDLVNKYGLDYVRMSGPDDAEKIWKRFEETITERPTLDFEIDGQVVKIQDLATQHELGDLNNRPRGQIAIKYESKGAETVIKDIIWQLGRSGKLSPVALIEPVDIGGVTIQRVTLNNRDYIKAIGASIGATVICVRQNDVIPAIVSAVGSGNGNTNEPTICPTCSDKLEIDGAYIICANIACAGLTFGDLVVWVRALKIKGIGPEIIRGLIENDIDNPAKLMAADVSQISKACNSNLNGEKIYVQLKQSLNMDMTTFLYALNVPHIGEVNSRRIAKQFVSIAKLMAASTDELAKVPGIKTTAETIKHALDEKIDLINELKKLITFKKESDMGKLASKSFCLTGELWAGRNEIHDMIVASGGVVKTSVSKDLDYLVTDDQSSGSGKNKKAKEYGVTVINGAELQILLQ
jgi:DNA ligase (NAD+)